MCLALLFFINNGLESLYKHTPISEISDLKSTGRVLFIGADVRSYSFRSAQATYVDISLADLCTFTASLPCAFN